MHLTGHILGMLVVHLSNASSDSQQAKGHNTACCKVEGTFQAHFAPAVQCLCNHVQLNLRHDFLPRIALVLDHKDAFAVCIDCMRDLVLLGCKCQQTSDQPSCCCLRMPHHRPDPTSCLGLYIIKKSCLSNGSMSMQDRRHMPIN